MVDTTVALCFLGWTILILRLVVKHQNYMRAITARRADELLQQTRIEVGGAQ
jgi:hypothetical protein